MLEHTLYLPDLALSDFFIFPKLKSSPKEPTFSQLKTSIRKWQSYLKYFHKMTSGDASRLGRLIWVVYSFNGNYFEGNNM
jgi:hypothetical protein